LLYRGASTRLDPPDFVRGNCTVARIGRLAVIVHRIDDGPGFDLYVERSLALFFWTWLAEAGRDCALAVEGAGANEGQLPI
jgi:sarcosine oxidase gamma subunit